ncbi:hypothetical protein SAMN05444172_8945 [Burkholderia sp. GAS332]|nr:hypothetical protein SAMN05444172_8945 [Burkholderia sp. GAS332]
MQRLAFAHADLRPGRAPACCGHTDQHDQRLPYLGREIPDGEEPRLDAGPVYQLLRDPDELAKAAQSSNGMPPNDPFDGVGHEHKMSAASPKKEIVVGSTDAAFDVPYLRDSLVVWDAKAILAIKGDTRRGISSAYYYRADMTPCTYDGMPYDGVICDTRGNHVALVRPGRSGPDVVMGDSKLESSTMSRQHLLPKWSHHAALAKDVAESVGLSWHKTAFSSALCRLS